MASISPPRPSLDPEGLPVVSGSERNNSISDTSPSGSTAMVDNSHRRSIQFNIQNSEPQPPSRPSSTTGRKNSQPESIPEKDLKVPGRGISPPPPQTYERGVSFDTFDNPDAPDFSLTLNYKHKGYQLTRRSRTFLCGTDQNDYSDFALEWLIDELVDDGDEIVCLRVVEKDSSITTDAAVEAGKYRQEAERLFEQVIQKNSQNEKAISLVLELVVGKVQEIIQRMIKIYEPAVLIVGTRGKNLNGVQGLLPGSVSKYCLQRSPIPVIVVRPSTKREKKKKKRLADPTRRSYNQILELSEQRGSHIFSAPSSRNSSVAKLPDEEAAVAAALGLPHSYTASRTSLSTSERSSVSQEGPMAPVGDSLHSLSKSLATDLSISSDETKTDSASSTLADSEQHNGQLREDISPGPGSTPLPTEEIPSSDDTTPEPSSPKTRIPVIVTDDDIPVDHWGKRRSL
ncbi:universal stress protein family domain protein [Aspergillus granulosus]|uniref:Universal stress protein family domain protein n=1 Tax=Aspergillus granulosus TaxID=176169 RepID=A0ABR4GTI7_9EURO